MQSNPSHWWALLLRVEHPYHISFRPGDKGGTRRRSFLESLDAGKPLAFPSTAWDAPKPKPSSKRLQPSAPLVLQRAARAGTDLWLRKIDE